MKKLLLTAVIAVMGVSMNAQSFNFGLKAGYSLSTLNAKNSDYKYDSKSSFYAGALAEYKVSSKFALQAELLYSQLGGESKYTESEAGVTYAESDNIKLGNLQIPVSAKYYATEKLAFGVGVNFGIITSAKNEYSRSLSGGGYSESENGKEDIKNNVQKLNLAPFIGAEYTFYKGLFADARYNLGVSNLIKNAEGNEKLTNGFFQIGLGYKFGGK
ncbi:porin family protein [Chryseobacterium oryctis]|uniref:PorT family protein n=1 Tax=Chryseobacterium oryctis TaxID=2952618 RepID=A0ABT3HPX6_9FLAO|nr:porin family protein [Chryseobacterium oryctis]MCW3161838.1 PorT family protein [Chryseobacterium oryctis]